MTGILKLVAAFGAGYTVCRYIEARAQRVPLDLVFQPGNLLRSVSNIAAIAESQRLQSAQPVGTDGFTARRASVPVGQLPTRMPVSVADAEFS